ncbi:MAG: hypothetical protein AB1427_00310 [Thermodesulfobacteriota bacterium]
MNTPRKGTAENKILVMWLIWGAMLATLGIYMLICNLFGDQVRRPMGPDFPLGPLHNILFGISIVVLISNHFIRKSMLKKPSGGPGSVSVPAPSPEIPAAIYAKYTTAMIVSLALCETVGIYGMVLFFLGDSLQTLYTFMVISAAGMIYYRPKLEEIEELSRAY